MEGGEGEEDRQRGERKSNFLLDKNITLLDTSNLLDNNIGATQ